MILSEEHAHVAVSRLLQLVIDRVLCLGLCDAKLVAQHAGAKWGQGWGQLRANSLASYTARCCADQ